MDTSDLGTPDYNLQKLVPNTQERIEWKKSSPLKQYKNKKMTPPSAEKTDGISRFGRAHKKPAMRDFLSTDKKVSQYLNVDVDNQMHYFKSSPYSVQKQSPKPHIAGSPRRGRPPKNQVKTPDKLQMALHDVLDKVNAMNDLQAPVPTSTETVDSLLINYMQKDEELLSDSEEVINEGDWNIGDLAWACVGGFPYWPCAVTKDPEENIFKKNKPHGKLKSLKEYLHVRFFGDKGRRSWIMTSHVIPFHGLDSFQSLAEETLTPSVKKKDPKLYKSFTIPTSMRKAWQAAVSEAESLREAPRQERITYFSNMFPPTPPSEKIIEVLVKSEPKKRGRKRKSDLNNSGVSQIETQIKVEKDDPDYYPPSSSKLPEIVRPATPTGFDLSRVKEEPISPTKHYSSNEDKSSSSPKIKTEPLSPPVKVPGRRGRPPGKRKKSDIETPIKRKYEKKSLEHEHKEGKQKRRTEDKKALLKDKLFKNPAFELFYDKNFDRVSAENPNLTAEDVEKFIEKMWMDVKVQKPMEFKSREGAEMASSDNSHDSTSSRADSPPPIIPPSSKTPYRRGLSLFAGARTDKVCQVCFKTSEEGEIFKCRGPCGQPFHFACADKPRYQVVEPKNEPSESVVVEKRKRGRPRSVNNTPSKSPVANVIASKTESQKVQAVPLFNGQPNVNEVLNSNDSPTKRKRGRPRKYSLPPSSAIGVENKNAGVQRELAMCHSISSPVTSSPASKVKSSSHEEEDFKGFTDEPREKYEKLLALKRKLLIEGILDCDSYIDSQLGHNSKDIDSDNNNKSVKEDVNNVSVDKISTHSDQDSHSVDDFSIELNSSKDSFITKDKIIKKERIILEKETSSEYLSKETCLSDKSISTDNTLTSVVKSRPDIATKAEVIDLNKNGITNEVKISKSIFDSAEENALSITNDSFHVFENSEISEVSPDANKNTQKAETNQSIEEEVQKGESSYLHNDSKTDNKLQMDTTNLIVGDEDCEKNDSKKDEIQNNSRMESTRRSNLKLLGTLRGDSFESESSNNNLVVDDSSADDRLMIEEVTPDCNSTLDCSETKSAILSILNEDCLDSGKLNTHKDSVKAADNNVENETKTSLDMPDLDLSDSEGCTLSATTNKVTNETSLADEAVLSNNDDTNKSQEGTVPNKILEQEDLLHSVMEECSNKVSEKEGNLNNFAEIPEALPLNVSGSIMDANSTDQVVPVSSFQPPGELSSAIIDEDAFLVVKKEGDVRQFSKPICNKSADISTGDNKDKAITVKEENGNTGKISAEKGKMKSGICGLCAEGKSGPCFICGKEGEEIIRCGYCGKVYHLQCAREWPQSQISETAKGRLLFYCPQHVCHTCVSDNPSAVSARFNNDRLVRCVMCPATYHYGNYCVPAGSEILSVTQLICPRHYVPQRKGLHHVNASWCFLCSVGGTLICCDLCPNSFHADCLKISPPEGAFICEDCETGRYPLYGEIVWVKLGTFRWWPARILFPQEVPDNINLLPHTRGEFAVEFFGSHDYYWVNRGRVFLYHEGDGCKLVTKNRVDELFLRGVQEASASFVKWCEEKFEREASSRTSMKPPKYVKIQANRLVGNVAKNIDTKENVAQTCECNPSKPYPCGPDSDCINRLLSVECDPDVCPAGENCCNQNFEKRNYPRLVPFKTESRGWGLKTLDPIKKGSFIIEYVGEMIDEEEYQRRLCNMQKNKDENFYFLTLDKDRMLDAGPKGNVARFMNHSCDPNCETQKWTVNGDTRVGLFALEDIKPDTELVFNYNLATVGDTKVECKCGSVNCAGFIGAKNNSKPGSSRQSKAQTPAADDKKSNTKKRKRKSKAASKHSEEVCFTCGIGGFLLLCDDSTCPKAYHLSCLGLTKHPAGGWVCPWHQCSVCSATKVQRCTRCINSYCAEHAEGNITLNRTHGYLCYSHNLSDSGSDWSDDRGNLSEDEDPAKTKTTVKKYSRPRILNGHID